MENRPKQAIQMEMVSFFGIQDADPEMKQEQYRAELRKKEDSWYITFKEETGSSLLKVSEEEVTVIRWGEITMRQPFRPGQETSGTYIGPAGKWLMETLTHELLLAKNSLGELIGVMWTYDLRLNGQEIGQNRVACHLTQS